MNEMIAHKASEDPFLCAETEENQTYGDEYGTEDVQSFHFKEGVQSPVMSKASISRPAGDS